MKFKLNHDPANKALAIPRAALGCRELLPCGVDATG